ncbi:MAG: radical SAM protein [Deltaproteobacteria bacterium]|nr:radical SAM protein [Deltaproteobacteria bacterium]
MERLGLGAWAREIEPALWAGRIPVDGTLEVTRACPFRCPHCYVTEADPREALGTPELLRIIDEVAAAGCLWLTLTGGEPLTRPDFPVVCRSAVARGLLVTVFTNGLLAEGHCRALLADLSLRRVEVSVYGFSEETCRRATGVPGTWERVRRNVEALAAAGVPLALKTVATRETAADIPALTRWADDLGVPFRFDPALNPKIPRPGGTVGAAGRRPLEERLPPEAVIQLEARFPQRVDAWRRMCSLGPPEPNAAPEPGLGCGAGHISFHMTAEGILTPCLLVPQLGVSLRDRTFEQAWHRDLPRRLAEARPGHPGCAQCPDALACDYCPAWALLEEGTWNGVPEYLCRLTQHRVEAFRGAAS